MIFVGLGNPGIEYKDTRHNVGFKIIDSLKKSFRIIEIYKKKLFNGWKIEIGNKEIIVLKPKTYMNESGKAVKSAIEIFNENIENLFVIHDDMDIELGKIKIVKDKGPGGHKGIISIIENIGTNEFFRIRIGIGRPPEGISPVDYVLSPFMTEEKELIKNSLKKTEKAIEEIIKSSVEKAMSLYNA
jgi:PTH1 family peptidyl-tRNA hydrolase